MTERFPTTPAEWRDASMPTLVRFRSERPDEYEVLRDRALGSRGRAPTTPDEWLTADEATLVRFRDTSPADYERLRDEAIRLAATRRDRRRK